MPVNRATACAETHLEEVGETGRAKHFDVEDSAGLRTSG